MNSESRTKTETVHDLLRRRVHPLDPFFSPGTVAVIGATERTGSVGRTTMQNLLNRSFGGTVYPVNPKHPRVFGLRSYGKVADLPEVPDLAVIVTPAAAVPGIVGECVDAGVKGTIVISAGFKETGTKGAELEREIVVELRRGRMRLIGPNCLGVMRPISGLNATFAGTAALPGSVGFISQSGALCTAILDWSLREHFGFSAFVSVGSMLDVGWGDLIDYLGDDPHTKSIILYMESIGNARAFLSAAREVALTKPIIVIKAGQTEAAARAAVSHTGALTGSDEALEAAFRRCGVLRVGSLSDLFDMAEVLAKQPRPKGKRLMIVTNAGGPGVLATDALISGGGELAELSGASREALDRFLPPHWSRGNPIDLLGDSGAERYAKAVEAVANDPSSDGLLVILAPQAMADPTQTAESLKPFGKTLGKPVLASWMGGAAIAAGEAILNQADIPVFPFPDTAARIFNYMWRYSENLRALYETPELPSSQGLDRARANEIIQSARRSGRTLLTEAEAKEVVAAYGIPTVPTRIAADEETAVRLAEENGYPAVLKLHSDILTHKSDVGGVKLNLIDAAAVRAAYNEIRSSTIGSAGAEAFRGVSVQPMVERSGYEVILGSSIDPDLGPVLLFGMGGQWVEVFRDRALALPPLNTTLARRMMEQTRIYTALKGIRGRPPVDLVALEQLLVRFSLLVGEQKWVKEIDINPLQVSSEGLLALDARMILHPPGFPKERLPGLAIRPYPACYVRPFVLKDGTPVLLRPIRPEDEPLMVEFHRRLSEESVYLRYLQALKLSVRTAHERLTRICFIDYDREMALVAEWKDPKTGRTEIVGAGRLTKLHGLGEAEFSLLIGDRFQGRGLGTTLLRRLVEIGREEGVGRITAEIHPENLAMQKVCERLGFRLDYAVGERTVKAVLETEPEKL
jgi:acetyltransferase